MDSFNTLKIGEKIDSPMSAFNNFIIELGNEISNIYDVDVYKTNNCVFYNDNILLFGFIKLIQKGNEIILKLTSEVNNKKFGLVRKTLDNFDKLSSIAFRYLFILNDIQKNYDDSVSAKYVEDFYNKVINLHKCQSCHCLVPFKNKILKCYDKDSKEILSKLYNKFSYILEVYYKENNYFKCNLVKVLSSDLNESNSIENIRPLEKEILNSNVISKENIYKFLTNLMYYGELYNN